MTNELKPCPFCGGDAILCENFDYAYVYCKDCGCQTDESRATANEAVDDWNTRAAVTDEQFSMAVHNGEAWQKVRECHLKPANGGGLFCSECGVYVLARPIANATEYLPPRYCPNCGAKVVE